MNVQLDLLNPVHRHDGEESRAAARKVDGEGQLTQVLVCLLDAKKPLTDDEIASQCGLLRNSAGTRRGVAVKRGWVEKAGRGVSGHGNPAATWMLTLSGVREAMSRRSAAA